MYLRLLIDRYRANIPSFMTFFPGLFLFIKKTKNHKNDLFNVTQSSYNVFFIGVVWKK